MTLGKNLGIVLHSHIPYVIGYGKWPHGLIYLLEAASESYLPLLDVLEKSEGKNILTFSVTPVLLEQLRSQRFINIFRNYLKERLLSAKEDLNYFNKSNQIMYKKVANFWVTFYSHQLNSNLDIATRFKQLLHDEKIDIITSAATHGYLPLLGYDKCIDVQIRVGVEAYERFFGKKPQGIWLPESAYRPGYRWKNPITGEESKRKGIEYFLSKYDLKFFFVDSHLIEGGEAIGVYLEKFEGLRIIYDRMKNELIPNKKPLNIYQPYRLDSEERPLFVFGRDKKTGLQVWSGEHGYPGDEWYLEFHKKKFPSGHRYWRVTNHKYDLADKKIYEPERVEERLLSHSSHFKGLVEEILKKDNNIFIAAPYDTELFGHWWFEGPQFLKRLIEGFKNSFVDLNTPANYLKNNQPEEVIKLPEGSWGKGGFHWIWLNDSTKWVWKKIYDAEKIMLNVAKKQGNDKVKDLMARELLLLESSDWEFLISTLSAKDYAENRISEHYENFNKLKLMLDKKKHNEGDRIFLKELEDRNKIFEFLTSKYYV